MSRLLSQRLVVVASWSLALAVACTVALASPASAVACDISSDAPVILGTAQSDVICGGPGNNVIYGGLLDDDIYGGGGNDVIIGGHGTDFMHGQEGNDVLRGGTGRDCYVGGVDNDTASFASLTPDADGAPGGIVADLDEEDADPPPPSAAPTCLDFAGTGRASGEGFNEELVGVENLVGSAFHDDLEAANSGANDLFGGWGDDAIRGRSSGGVDDGLRGERGGDTCRNNGSAVACADAPEGSHRPAGAFAAVESRGQDSGVIVMAREGSHVDSLSVTRPSSSTVRIDVGEAPAASGGGCPVTGQTITCTISTPRYVVVWGDDGGTTSTPDRLTIGNGFPGEASLDLNGGPGSDVVTGGSAGEILFTGEGGADRLIGGDGADALLSEGDPVGSGGDWLDGGGGNDQLVTDNACAGHTLIGGPSLGVGDIVGFARQTDLRLGGNDRGVWAKLGEGATAGQAYADPMPPGCVASQINGGSEILEGTNQADELRGNTGANTIWGRDGNDELYGLEGNDVLHGHAHADTVYGNEGNDTVWGEDGVDTLLGGDDADKLRALDNVQDAVVNCGAGVDYAVQADPSDPVASCNEQ